MFAKTINTTTYRANKSEVMRTAMELFVQMLLNTTVMWVATGTLDIDTSYAHYACGRPHSKAVLALRRGNTYAAAGANGCARRPVRSATGLTTSQCRPRAMLQVVCACARNSSVACAMQLPKT